MSSQLNFTWYIPQRRSIFGNLPRLAETLKIYEFISVIAGCKADIALLVDKSGSIIDPSAGGDPGNWNILKTFLENVMVETEFGQDPDGTHFGLIYFANNANLFLQLNDCQDLACARTAINRASPPVSKML